MVEPFPVSFGPPRDAVTLLADIANSGSAYAPRATEVLAEWRSCLATQAEIEAVEANDELEIDCEGACVSRADDGFWVQCWSWVPYALTRCLQCDTVTEWENDELCPNCGSSEGIEV